MSPSTRTNAPKGFTFTTVPFIASPFLNFSSASFHGSAFSALIDNEILSLSSEMICALTLSPTLNVSAGFSISCQSSSEICTSPSSSLGPSPDGALGVNFTNTPKFTTPETSPVTTSPTLYIERIFFRSLSCASFSDTISFSSV